MSGAVAAHAAYNGSGTQGLAVTNKIDGDADVVSVFWNKNDTTRQLLHGSSIIEIPPSGSGGSLTKGGSQLFTINNDLDSLGDLYLQISTGGWTGIQDVGAFDLLKCIRRIEFMVGTQVWQTLEEGDINALNVTEMSEDAFESFFLSMSGGFNATGTRNPIDAVNGKIRTTVANDITGVLRIPALSRNLGSKLAKFSDVTQHAYLLAGAPNQAVKVRVYMATTTPITRAASFNLKLFGQCGVMCNEEREQIKAMPMGLPKRLKTTQNTTQTFPVQSVANTPVVTTCQLDIDHFSLYASHIVLVLNDDASNFTNSSIKSVELKLNSSSFSGVLEGPLLTGPVADSLGLYSNELQLGSVNLAPNHYIFPIASRAYGASSVPLNRFDNIRMEIEIVTESTSSTQQPIKISATCVGETTALYKGGAASLAMY